MRKLPFNAGVIIIKPQAKLDAIVRRKVELVVGLQAQLALARAERSTVFEFVSATE